MAERRPNQAARAATKAAPKAAPKAAAPKAAPPTHATTMWALSAAFGLATLFGVVAAASSAQADAAALDACREASRSEAYERAVRLCGQAIDSGTLAPENRALAHHHRGVARIFLGQFLETIRDYDEALKLDPGNGTYHNNRGWAHWLRGDTAAAAEDARIAGTVRGDAAFVRDTLAHVYASQGRREEALSEYELAMQIDPSYVALYQQALIEKGYRPGRVDGVYDAATRAALIRCIEEDCRLLDQRDILSS